MTLDITSAHSTLFHGEVSSVTLPGEMGSFTVLRNHASLLSSLTEGKIVYRKSDGSEGNVEVNGGVVDVDNNVISVCVY